MLADIILRIASETQEPRQPYRPRPSLAGQERCIRQLTYFARDFAAAPFPGRAIVVFDDGNWHQELLADWIRKSSFTLHSEGMKVDTLVGRGEIDGVITDMLNVDRLLEIKSTNHFSYERWWKGEYPLDYFTQVALYISGLQKVQPEISEGLLLAKNKNTGALMEFLLKYDSETDTIRLIEVVRSDGQRSKSDFAIQRVCQSAKEKFDEVERHRKAKTLPDRPFAVGTEFPCGYCAWAKTCWQNYESEFVQLAKEQEIDQELEDVIAYYLQASGDAKEMDKEADRLKEIIRNYMREKEYQSGRVGPYVVIRSLRQRTSWDEDLIPPDVVALAKQEKSFEVLTIRKPEEKKKK